MELHELKNYVRDVPDFPKKGILFKDISPFLASAKARNATTQALYTPFAHLKIDVVVGIESRGLLFGMSLADRLNAAFVMVRKPNKLPGKVLRQSYDLEYGADFIELQETAFQPGANVLIHDDVLATGGTAAAAAQLIQQAGGNVVGASFIIELEFLKGRLMLNNMMVKS